MRQTTRREYAHLVATCIPFIYLECVCKGPNEDPGLKNEFQEEWSLRF